MDTQLKLKLTIDSGPSMKAKVMRVTPGVKAGIVSTSVRVGDGTDYPEFEGPYDIVPTLEGLEVSTEGKRMADDLEIEPIPIARTSNPSGGYTCVIG